MGVDQFDDAIVRWRVCVPSGILRRVVLYYFSVWPHYMSGGNLKHQTKVHTIHFRAGFRLTRLTLERQSKNLPQLSFCQLVVNR